MKPNLLFLICSLSLLINPLAGQGQLPGAQLFGHDRTAGNSIDEASNNNFFPQLAPFYHGVASGDPLEDRVIIWTRVTPEVLDDSPIDVSWRVATDPALQNIVTTGMTTTNQDRDYTVKVDVTGLQSGTTYYYGFTAFDLNSLTGRSKTTPTAAESDHLKFGVVSCSNFQAGYFNGYGRLAELNDLDAVIHLGDYIYEYGNYFYGDSTIWDDRIVSPPTEIVNLFDYRTRYGTYRLDTQLLRMHQQHPIIAIWDDHESANDSYEDGANNHDPVTEGPWETRKSVARQAYFEWMPIRENADTNVYRSIQYGELADLILLDTRLEGRNQQINDVTDSLLYAEDRTILGETQRNWLFEQLDNSTAKWKIVGQQVIFSSLNVGWAGSGLSLSYDETESLFLDIWDGYPADRQRVIDHLVDNQIDNVVILTGDFHSSFAYDVAEPPTTVEFMDVPGAGIQPFYQPTDYDPETGAGSVAVEFATPSITSANFDENVNVSIAQAIQGQINNTILAGGGVLNLGNPNPHMKLVDLIQHGYYVLDIKADSVQANFFYTPISTDTDDLDFGGARYTKDGENHLNPAAAPSPNKNIQDFPAPADPPSLINATTQPISPVKVLATYPNPADVESNLHFNLTKSSYTRITIFDQLGRHVADLHQGMLAAGLYTLKTSVSELPPGQYYYHIDVASFPAVVQPLIIR